MKHSELLRPLLLQGLLKIGTSTDACEFKQWISSGKFVVRAMPSATEIEIEINNDHAFENMIAYDSCRMASAAFETMENVQSTSHLPKSYGWIAIKCYYAAFFSAHSIMRCFGFTCSQLERGHVNLLRDYAQAIGLPGPVQTQAGFFSGSYDLSTKKFVLKKLNNTHEDTWATFLECLNKLSIEVLRVQGVSAHKSHVSSYIDDLIKLLTDGNRLPKGNYLSQFRNAVNYRQEHHSWYPYGKTSIRSDKIISLVSTWKNEDQVDSAVWKESRDAHSFFSACRQIVNLNYILINLIVNNSETNNNLYYRWPYKLLNTTSKV